MYVLDTNVVSELRKANTGRIDHQVAAWVARIDARRMFISCVTLMELEIGVLTVEARDPKQGSVLRAWITERVRLTFADRILSFDADVAILCARLNVPDRCARNDGMIAATALRHGMTVVTRNTSDFIPTGVPTLNPWLAPA